MKFEIDEELWYGVSSDEKAEAEAAKSMAARMGRIVGAKPFPAAAQRLSQITQNPNCLMDEVVAVLESDPALSARLLRLVNSVGFSLRTACTSVRHAAALVGTEKLNQVASTAAILDMYESGSEKAAELLEHATVVGALCRYLAFHFGLPPDELFTCGFLHDIGKLMMLDTEGDDYLELLGKETPEFDTTFIEERNRFGFDHALLAGHVLAAWNIPHPVPKVVAWHHHVTRAYAESTEISQMVSTLRLADAMSYALRKSDTQVQIETLARTEAASYMDISEGQLAAMWEEVRALAERARAVFRGEKVEEVVYAHTSRPSGTSMRAVARAKQQDRVATPSMAPMLSERPRQFPCVVCDAPSYAHKCGACHGYMCPLHVAGEDEWCELCERAYQKAGIPAIRPVVSTLFGSLCGGLLAAAFFGAASAGAQRPLKLMLGPTLILMLLGMLAGVGQRWVRRWWFLRSRPDRASFIPAAVEAVLDAVAKQSTQILEIVTRSDPSPATERLPLEQTPGRTFAQGPSDQSLRNPEFPSSPAVPDLEGPNMSSSSPRAASSRERHWMSNAYKTPIPAVDRETMGALSEAPSALTGGFEREGSAVERLNAELASSDAQNDLRHDHPIETRSQADFASDDTLFVQASPPEQRPTALGLGPNAAAPAPAAVIAGVAPSAADAVPALASVAPSAPAAAPAAVIASERPSTRTQGSQRPAVASARAQSLVPVPVPATVAASERPSARAQASQRPTAGSARPSAFQPRSQAVPPAASEPAQASAPAVARSERPSERTQVSAPAVAKSERAAARGRVSQRPLVASERPSARASERSAATGQRDSIRAASVVASEPAVERVNRAASLVPAPLAMGAMEKAPAINAAHHAQSIAPAEDLERQEAPLPASAVVQTDPATRNDATEAPDSGWSRLLDTHGTASGW